MTAREDYARALVELAACQAEVARLEAAVRDARTKETSARLSVDKTRDAAWCAFLAWSKEPA